MRPQAKVLIPTMLESVSAGALVESVARLPVILQAVGDDQLMNGGIASMVERVFLHDDESPRRHLLSLARKDEALSDFLVRRALPEVAARLETGWNEDRLSFVDVTIAATRIQDAVRAAGRFALPPRNQASVMMIVPHWEQHTLPAIFAAETLRGLGAPTSVMAGMGNDELAAMIGRRGPSALMLSVGSYRSIARVGELIETLRRAIPRALPVVLGGPALTMEPDAWRTTGADFATNDPANALRFCEFPLSPPVSAEMRVDA